MRLIKAIPVVMLVGSAVAGSSAWAMDSKDFLTQAMQGNFAEISAGQLAEQKGATDAVKQYGATLVTDHTKANQDAMKAAQTMGVTPPTGPNDDQKKMHDRLAGENGATFDKDFLDSMVSDHNKDASMYQDVIDHNKDAAGQYASATLPVIQAHLAKAQALANDTSASATPSSGMAAALAPGANSFTEGQAKERIEKAGYSNVSGLKKDDQGIWRGMGNKNGQPVTVGLDFKGNVGTVK